MATGIAWQKYSPSDEPGYRRFGAHAAKPHVVLVDDDELFRESLCPNLGDNGYEVTALGGGVEALEYFNEGGSADVVLLDWRMPEIDGLEVLRRLRRDHNSVPVIFLTVLDDEIYEEAALAGGAVDFVEKSRSLSILLRRISLIINGQKPTGKEVQEARISRHDKLELNHMSKRAKWDGKEIGLTLTEFNILCRLIENPGTDVPYRDIYDLVHGEGFIAGSGVEGYRANVRTFIKRIRKKFRELDDAFDHIENYPGFGYRWKADQLSA